MFQSSRKSVLNKLHVYTNDDLPFALLKAIIKITEKHHKESDNRIGLMGVTKEVAESYGYKHIDMLNDKKSVEVGVKHFSSILKRVRTNYPSLPFRDWYLLALACYRAGYERLVKSLKRANNWMDIKISHRSTISNGITWAEDVWKCHLDLDGKKVI